jgi:hypothetical protein
MVVTLNLYLSIYKLGVLAFVVGAWLRRRYSHEVAAMTHMLVVVQGELVVCRGDCVEYRILRIIKLYEERMLFLLELIMKK